MHDRRYTVPTGPVDIRALKLLFPYLLSRPKRVAIALSCLILAKLANVFVPMILKYIIDSLTQLQKLPAEQALAMTPIVLILIYGFFRFATVLFGELRDAVFCRVSEGILSEIGVKVFKHLHALDLEYHLTRKTGGLSRDIERGTNAISFLLRSLIFSIIPIVLEVGMVTIILIINFSVSIGLIAIGSIVAYIAYSVVVTQWRTQYVRVANEIDSAANTRAIDSLLNYETVKYFNNERYETDFYQNKLKEREEAKVKNYFGLFVLNCGQAAIIALGITSILWFSAQDVATNQLTIGDFAMLNAYMIQVFIPLGAMGFIYREMRRALADFEAMFKITELKPGVSDRDDVQPLPDSLDKSIAFDKVSFSYRQGVQALNNISFTIPEKSRVAVVGPSGAGKSTLARLIYRFYEPQSGQISIGGMPLNAISLESYRQAIGVVPQDTVLFHDSIYKNIQYGRPSASRSEVEQAADMANLTAFIDKLPDGYDTVVGERGLKISGGEKQRVAIARAILKQPDILVFDEATSSLDSESEQAIMASFNQLAKSHTTLIIAHRLSTIQNADLILVLSNGEIVEQGSHNELLSKQGLYKTLWDYQQADVE